MKRNSKAEGDECGNKTLTKKAVANGGSLCQCSVSFSFSVRHRQQRPASADPKL